MKRAELEKYLNQNVSLKLFDDCVYNGELHKTGEEIFKNNANLMIPRNYYFVTTNDINKEIVSCLFRCTHVKKVVIIGRESHNDVV